jgi:hypothetical protein
MGEFHATAFGAVMHIQASDLELLTMECRPAILRKY